MHVTTRRLGAFATVGVLGFALQLGVLALLTSLAHWTWLPATVVAVELAVIHNYLWHERWTWRDRKRGRTPFSVISAKKGYGPFFSRFARFNVANGLASIAGNIALMWVLVARIGMPAVAANVLAVGVLAAANFAVADRWVFASAVAFMFLLPAAADAAPARATLDAWDRYVAQTEAQLEHARGGAHLVARDSLTASGESVAVPSGTVSHWRGSVFISGMTVDRLLDGLMHPGTPPPQEDVVSSRVLARGNDSLRVYMRLVRRAIITVTYDTEHEMTFTRRSPTLATARSVATRIEEVGGNDHGFLWRLHSYWRYEQTPEGVLVELDSLTLSRDVPSLVRPMAAPLVNRIARESMYRTLAALRRFFE